MRKLVLFDIDGTLVHGIHAHKESFRYAFKRVYGIDTTIDIIRYSGMTDQRIIIETLKRNGLKEEFIRSKLKECMLAMIDYYRKAVKDEEIVVLEGVKELLEELKTRKALLGLVTGNVREIAMLKLKKVDLHHYFKVGAFGDESVDKSDLVRLVMSRVGRKLNFRSNDVFFFGDTPRDMRAGKDVGITTIGVATGIYKEEELQKAGADFVFKSLRDTERILKIISHESENSHNP